MGRLSFVLFDGLLLLAAASDVRRYRIPNALSALLALGGLLLAFPATPGEALSRCGSFATLGLITGVLWLRGLLGGGDMKLLVACAAWIPFSGLAQFGLAFGVASVVQGLTALAWRRFAQGAPLAQAARTRLPYALSIATAGFFWSWTALHAR